MNCGRVIRRWKVIAGKYLFSGKVRDKAQKKVKKWRDMAFGKVICQLY
jgi:hypothetical protein